ncbi:uncharacterized protein THITE_2170937 [Thermothielavioides terrestris NRRL 8126]|uniref:Uncharacterized protein n=1 Tax=Thermothielavioides terrestris (strain ATCC 38088 / NRRL 8126) TaxID=578455 RepID=G2RBJ4_THETT|nr:uncharacterized protein THITE_2170937 [Thermothielavioides terrestris NRRL 8126]AEO69165.1 hypothetical protein THITE_2170937 [Thermothielavioides terrestris NRRL 8126]
MTRDKPAAQAATPTATASPAPVPADDPASYTRSTTMITAEEAAFGDMTSATTTTTSTNHSRHSRSSRKIPRPTPSSL